MKVAFFSLKCQNPMSTSPLQLSHSALNQPLNIPIGPTLIQYGSLKRKIVAVLFFCTLLPDNFFSLKFDPTLTSHNLGLKNYSNKNHHIFRKPWTSAFRWHTLNTSEKFSNPRKKRFRLHSFG